MSHWSTLSHKSHTGRLRPHEHTSYLSLGLLLAIVGLGLISYTGYAASPAPESSSVSLTGTVPGKPPTTAATIQTPTNGRRFSSTPVNISGTCPANTLVELFKNDIFAGSIPCSSAGIYALDIDLLIGENKLSARVYDALNQPGPVSNIVTVYYDILPGQASPLTPLNFGGAQLLINTDAVFRGVFPQQELVMPIALLGGTGPFAVNIQWGDSTNKVIPRNDNSTFSTGHIYQKSGTYQISIQATDAQGRVAFLTVAAIVNGQSSVAAANNTQNGSSTVFGSLLVLWPLYTAVVAAVASFWLGERREKYLLKKGGLLLTTRAS